MSKGIKIKWIVLIAIIMIALVVSVLAFPTAVQASKSNFKNYYKYVECKKCETKYDENYKDSYGNPRQYGVKMSQEHQNKMSEEAYFYDYGYTDYNCLAYALGEQKECNWKWPNSWGSHPSKKQVERFFKLRFFNVEDYDESKGGFYKDKRAIYVYGYLSGISGEYIITHFGRTDDIDGNMVEGASTLSKWGAGAIYSTKSVNCYGESCSYGKCVMVCYK